MRSAGTPAGSVAISCRVGGLGGLERLRISARSPSSAAAAASAARSQVRLGEPVHVGEVGRLARDDAHPGAALAPSLRALDARLVDRQREPGPVLAEDLGEVAAVGQRPREHQLGEVGFDQGSGGGTTGQTY